MLVELYSLSTMRGQNPYLVQWHAPVNNSTYTLLLLEWEEVKAQGAQPNCVTVGIFKFRGINNPTSRLLLLEWEEVKVQGAHTNCVTVGIFKFRGNVWQYRNGSLIVTYCDEYLHIRSK